MAERRSPLDRVLGVAPAVAISVAYLLIRPASNDFASGDFRARLFRQGAYVWNLHWFAGHPLPGYGLVTPFLSAHFGVVPIAVLSTVVAAWAFAAIVAHCRISRPSLPSPTLAVMLFSVGCGLSLWGGRLTFGPSVAFGALCVLCIQRDRFRLALLTGALCGLSSPVGALSLGIVIGALWAAHAFPRRRLLAVGCACLVPPTIIGLLFPEGGWYPFPGGSFMLLCVALAAIGWCSRRMPTVRVIVLLYGLVSVAAFVIRSPLGGNIVRFAWLAAGPAAVLTFTKFRRTLLPMFVVFTLVWGWSYVRLGLQPADASADAKFYEPLATFVLAQPGGVKRVEVVPTASFRQADELALTIEIARGWEVQVDRELNPEFYGKLTADTYHQWLRRNAVGLVALPSSGVQPSSQGEQEVIEAVPDYLRLMWSTPQWKVYEVVDGQPLADNGATVTSVGATTLTISARHAGLTNIRFRYSTWFHVTTGNACTKQSPDGWLQLDVTTPGTVIAEASFSLNAAAGNAEQCA